MSITVVVRRQARPGQADQLLALARERMNMILRRPDRRFRTQVFQSRADPHGLLWVGAWESEADFRAAHGTDEFREVVTAPRWEDFPSTPVLFEVVTEVG